MRGRKRTGGLEIFKCVREDDPRLACVEIPAWMFDEAMCSGMRLSEEPHAAWTARDLLQDEALSGEDRTLTKYLKPDLLIVDDMGMKQLPKKGGEFLFEVIMRRHEVVPRCCRALPGA